MHIQSLGTKYCGYCKKKKEKRNSWKIRLMWEMVLRYQLVMLASIIKFSSIPPHQISWDYQGRMNSKLLVMNHFTNCIAPTFMFLVIGTSLINTITDIWRGCSQRGRRTPGSSWTWVETALPSFQTGQNCWKNQDPRHGPRLPAWDGDGFRTTLSIVLSMHRKQWGCYPSFPSLSTSDFRTLREGWRCLWQRHLRILRGWALAWLVQEKLSFACFIEE